MKHHSVFLLLNILSAFIFTEKKCVGTYNYKSTSKTKSHSELNKKKLKIFKMSNKQI